MSLDQVADELPPGMGWIGWDYLGHVDRLESESISTRFFCFVVPLWPSYSIYESTAPTGERQYIQIPRQRRSVVLGYLRVHLGLAGAVLAAAAVGLRHPVLAVVALACIVASVLLTLVAGKLSPAEHERRRLLRRATGLGAPPELLPTDLLHAIREELLDAWHAESPIPWYQAIVAGYANEILVALAEYHQRQGLIEQARLNMQS